MTRLETLVTLLIEPHQPPQQSSITDSGERFDPESPFVEIHWDNNKHIVVLEACAHRVLLKACFNDGGPCPPERLFWYSHTRLEMLLKWMNAERTVADLDALQYDLAFHQKYKTDPIITKYMWGGYLNNSILKNAMRLKYKRDVK